MTEWAARPGTKRHYFRLHQPGVCVSCWEDINLIYHGCESLRLAVTDMGVAVCEEAAQRAVHKV